MKELSNGLNRLAEILEVVLAIVIAVAVVGGIIGGVTQMVSVASAGEFSNITYDSFKEFLEYMLILVVGVEFILMLLTHSITRVVELVVFVIARKMLIYGSNMVDMLLASIAIAVIMATIKYLPLKEKVEEEELV